MYDHLDLIFSEDFIFVTFVVRLFWFVLVFGTDIVIIGYVQGSYKFCELCKIFSRWQ